ncbi:alpha-1-antiproteinase-like [Lissotriton helveticus]
MRPSLYVCGIITLLIGGIHCDHHPDHVSEANHTTVDAHGKEHHHVEHHGNGHHGQEHHDEKHNEKKHHGKGHTDGDHHGKKLNDHKHSGEKHHEQEQPEDVNICQKITSANTGFAFNFYKHLTSNGKSGNVFVSPMSISTALSMLSLGARFITHKEIIESMGFNLRELSEQDVHAGFHHLMQSLNKSDNELHLSTGNALFIQEGLPILPQFLQDVKSQYDSEVVPSNFNKGEEAKKQINDYVLEKTHGKIAELLPNIDQGTVLVLVNYIFFKGSWTQPFNSNFTAEGDFFVDENTTVKVPMMRRYSTFSSYRDADLGCKVVQLDYAGNASAMLILPNKGMMKQVEDALSVATLEKWTKSLSPQVVNLYVPKFSISVATDLMETLKEMGIKDVFSDNADLSGITGSRGLKVSQAVHKAALSLDEQGTEAAGATAIGIMPVSFVFPTKFNCPFFVLIRHHITNSVLFLGKIVNPTIM